MKKVMKRVTILTSDIPEVIQSTCKQKLDTITRQFTTS
jgi:hypothetical protein